MTAKAQFAVPGRTSLDRSLITLKALTYAPTGGMVAAPDDSLPEQLAVPQLGLSLLLAARCDATLLALMNAGYTGGSASMARLAVARRGRQPEPIADHVWDRGRTALNRNGRFAWLPGYEKSSPVRIGNAAHTQLQLDVYGELMDALHHRAAAGDDSKRSRAGLCS